MNGKIPNNIFNHKYSAMCLCMLAVTSFSGLYVSNLYPVAHTEAVIKSTPKKQVVAEEVLHLMTE